MNSRKASEMAARFRLEAEQDIQQGLARGTQPRCEYESLVMEMSTDADRSEPRVLLASLQDCLEVSAGLPEGAPPISVGRAI